MTCGNALLKPLLFINLEKMPGNQNAACGEYFPMQPIGNSFTLMMLANFGAQMNTSSTFARTMKNKSPLSTACITLL
jgi:hypothetical protein